MWCIVMWSLFHLACTAACCIRSKSDPYVTPALNTFSCILIFVSYFTFLAEETNHVRNRDGHWTGMKVISKIICSCDWFDPMFFAIFWGCYLNCSNISFHFKKYVEVKKFYTLISSGGGPEKWAISKCEKRYLAVKKGAAHFWLKQEN